VAFKSRTQLTLLGSAARKDNPHSNFSRHNSRRLRMNRLNVWAIAVALNLLSIHCFAAEDVVEPSEDQPATKNVPAEQPQRLPAPFKLTKEGQAEVTMVLEAWERRSKKFKNYSCNFDCIQYHDFFPPTKLAKGKFRTDHEGRFYYFCEGALDLHGQEGGSQERSEYIADGESWSSASSDTKQVARAKAPPDVKRSLSAPFVLRADAKALSEQFYIRITKHDKAQGQISLQFYPRFVETAGWLKRYLRGQGFSRSWRDYDHVDLMLSDDTYIPLALQLYDTKHSRTTYIANNPTINVEDTRGWFESELPEDWTRN
jgi:hypothetical protein